MKVENWKLLRNAVADSAQFDMADFFHTCGTPACLVGHIATIMLPERNFTNKQELLYQRQKLVHVSNDILSNWLGIESTELGKISMGQWSGKGLRNITQQDALDWLDECIAKGHVTRI